MSDLQKGLGHRNFTHVAMKKIKSYCSTRNPTEQQLKKYKRKMSKSVYIRQDLADKTIRYTNLGVIEADEFRKNLNITNNQSIRIEREIIAIIMKIFAKENTVRQYQILKLPLRVNLCFVDHKLVIEIDEDGHPCYENDETRQKFIESLGFTFIRINPDPDSDASFDLDVGIAKICSYINKSSIQVAVNLAEKSLKEKFAKELLNYISRHIKNF